MEQSPVPRLLFVEDDPDLRDYYMSVVARRYGAVAVGSVAEARVKLGEATFDLVATDLGLPDGAGLEVAGLVRAEYPQTEVIVITGQADLDTAIEAVRLGIVDYLKKPVSRDDLLSTLARCLEKARVIRTLESVQRNDRRPGSLGTLLGDSPAMENLRHAVVRVSHSDCTVLVQGETGTGKELVARALHHGGHRAAGPFVAVNCAAVAADLLESELFGHEEGAFTGANRTKKGLIEEADGGTFFLDEVGELPLPIQAKLLRVLQEREVMRLGGAKPRKVDFRLVAATNRDLATEVEAGRFRRDLFYRLNVYPVRTPSLAARPDDIPALALHFLDAHVRGQGRGPVAELAAPVVERLRTRPWPGNVRELQNFMERVALVARGERIGIEDLKAAEAMEGLGAEAPATPAPASSPAGTGGPGDLAGVLDRLGSGVGGWPSLQVLEDAYLARVLAACGGNKAQAARILGIHPATLSRKVAS